MQKCYFREFSSDNYPQSALIIPLFKAEVENKSDKVFSHDFLRLKAVKKHIFCLNKKYLPRYE